MPLTSKHRSALYEALAPLAGEEATEAMLSDHPTSEADAPVTKDFLRAELAELRGDIADLRAEIKAQTLWTVGAVTTILGALVPVIELLGCGVSRSPAWLRGGSDAPNRYTTAASIGAERSVRQGLGSELADLARAEEGGGDHDGRKRG